MMRISMRLFLLLLAMLLAMLASAQTGLADESSPTVRHLADAIRIPTISQQDREQIDVSAFSRFLSFLRQTYPAVFASLETETINQYSLLLRWPGQAPELEPVLFDAHYDVVPIEPGTENDWTHPPFSGVVENGFVWGRGSIDDKLAVMTTLEAIDALLASGFRPTRTLFFSFVHDEEIGGDEGAGAIARLLLERGHRFAYVIGEGGALLGDYPLLPDRPTAMIGLAEKTYLTLALSAEAQGGHSSMPPRDSSIIRLSKALTALHENPFKARLVSPVTDMLKAIGEQTTGLRGFLMRNPWLGRPALLSQMAQEPVGNAMTRTTTAVTMFSGGVKENVVPQRSEARVNFRLLPDEKVEDLIEAVTKLIDDASIKIQALPSKANPQIADIEGEGYRRLRAALEAVVPDITVIPGLVMATTDSRHYGEITSNVYRFHPINVGGDLVSTIHGTNERISVTAVKSAVAIYRQLIQNVAAGSPPP